MNKQRKVLVTITYNEMGTIIDTKAEEVAQPNLQLTCNQLATDCISRQAAIEAMRTCYDTERKDFDNGDEFINYAQAVGELKNLSSVSGVGWIPCKEWMPEMPKGQEYYSFNGKNIVADEYIVMIKGAVIPTTLYWTGNEWFDPYISDDTYNVIAWMPLPEPYREKGSIIDFNAVIKKAAKEQCEISVVTKPNGETEINVHPWKPSKYRTTTEIVEDQQKEDK